MGLSSRELSTWVTLQGSAAGVPTKVVNGKYYAGSDDVQVDHIIPIAEGVGTEMFQNGGYIQTSPHNIQLSVANAAKGKGEFSRVNQSTTGGEPHLYGFARHEIWPASFDPGKRLNVIALSI